MPPTPPHLSQHLDLTHLKHSTQPHRNSLVRATVCDSVITKCGIRSELRDEPRRLADVHGTRRAAAFEILLIIVFNCSARDTIVGFYSWKLSVLLLGAGSGLLMQDVESAGSEMEGNAVKPADFNIRIALCGILQGWQSST